MQAPGSANALMLGSGEVGEYTISRSLRLRSAASAYLTRTPGSAGNRQKYTWSGWVKRGALGSLNTLFGAGTTSPDYDGFRFNSSDQLNFFQGGAVSVNLTTTAVFRDPSAWYHVVLAVDTTLSTAAYRVTIYVNGIQQTLSGTYPSQNAQAAINNTYVHGVGSQPVNGSHSGYFDGYLSDVNFIDGQQIPPSYFGEYDTVTGVFKPKRVTAVAYGTNGFSLNFSDNSAATAAAIGKDTSGNGNNFTPGNVSVTSGVTYDSMTDVPMLTSATAANYAVLNPLIQNSYITLSNGNLTATNGAGNYIALVASSIAMVGGQKYYFELTCQSGIGSNYYQSIGIWGTHEFASYGGSYTTYYSYSASDGTKYNGSSSSAYGATWTNGDIIGTAVDLVNGTITFYKNGVSQGVAFTGINTALSYYAALYCYTTQATINFGQRPFAYTPPSGFVALNTFNLPDPTIVAGNKHFNAVLWNGAGVDQSITGVGFKPDFVWIKNRDNAGGHRLHDILRPADNSLKTHVTDAEGTESGLNFTFESDGFSVDGNRGDWNYSGRTYVAWNWKASGSASTNTAGSITSQVSANPSAGFSVVTYTAQASGTGTVGHGLGVAPSFIITKPRGNASWVCYSQQIGADKYLLLDTTGASATNVNVWNNTPATSSVFSLGSGYAGYGAMVAYCFAEVAGYSKFGSVDLTNAADGVFLYLGFRPRFILMKQTNTTGNWVIFDSARSQHNFVDKEIYPNSASAEATGGSTYSEDFLSNGIKFRNQGASGTWIYAAFAENPFKYSLAR